MNVHTPAWQASLDLRDAQQDTSLRYPPLGRDFTQDELAAITKRLRMQAAVDRATGFDRADEESE